MSNGPRYQRDKLSADSFPAREGSHVGISKVFLIHKPRPMLHNFPPLPPNYDGTILIEMPERNVDIAALSWLTVLLQLVVWARAGTLARGLFLGFLGLPVLLRIFIITSHSHHFTPAALPLSFHVLRQPLRYLAQRHQLNLRVARGTWLVARARFMYFWRRAHAEIGVRLPSTTIDRIALDTHPWRWHRSVARSSLVMTVSL